MQHGDFEKTKVLKTQRDSKSDVRKPNSKSVLNSVQSDRPVLHTNQIGWTYPKATPVPLPDSTSIFLDFFSFGPDMSNEQYAYWNLNSTGLVQPSLDMSRS
jgi:hypothetical protein